MAQALAQRAPIVLAVAGGYSNGAIASARLLNSYTASKWRRRFRNLGSAGLFDEPRPGAPRTNWW